MDVFLSKQAETKLIALSNYLLENWNIKTRNQFFGKLTKRTKQIASHPYSCPESKEFKGLYKCVVSKHTSFYYRIKSNQKEIEIITVFDSIQNPSSLQMEIE